MACHARNTSWEKRQTLGQCKEFKEFKEELMKLARIIVQQGRFDQLILYPTFLHVSYKRNGANRHKVLRKTATGYAEISHREIC